MARQSRYLVAIRLEGILIGGALIASGIAALPIELTARRVSPVFACTLFFGGLVFSVLIRRYTRLDLESLANADAAPHEIHNEPIWHLALRITSVVLVVVVIYGVAQSVAPAVTPFVGGIVVAHGADELRVTRWIRQWEEERKVQLIAAAPSVFFYPRSGLPVLYRMESKADVVD